MNNKLIDKRSLAALMALSLTSLQVHAQVEPLSDAEKKSMGGSFGAVARGEATEREGVLASEAGKHTIAGGMAADLPGSKKKAAPADNPTQGPASGMGGPTADGMGGMGAGMGAGPPGNNDGIQYPKNDNPRDFAGPWTAMLITGTGELLDVPSGERPGPQVISPYEATRLCSGTSGMMATGFNARVRDEQITLLLSGTNYARVRRIFMNAQHPATVQTTFSGHSVGKWDGDTLVVDTVGIKGIIGRLRDPVSLLMTHVTMATPTLHVVERFRKIGTDQLEVLTAYDDNATGMKPYSMKVTYKFGSMDTEVEEVCEAVGDLFGPEYTQGVLK
ncbi:MAG: hypothetical protein QM808_05020 [Steroidobacteraceae bacterium]